MKQASPQPPSGTLRDLVSGVELRPNLTSPNTCIDFPAGLKQCYSASCRKPWTNVHRHSGSRAVEVRVTAEDSRVVLTVKDFGMGVPREVLDHFWKTGNVGVGLAGIRERLKELGGALAIESNLDGTLLSATIPYYATDGLDPDDGVPSRQHSAV